MNLYFVFRKLTSPVSGAYDKYGLYFLTKEDVEKFAENECRPKSYRILMIQAVKFD